MATFDFAKPWSIAIESGTAVAACAARELAECVRAITGRTTPVLSAREGNAPGFRLAHGESSADGFCWAAEGDEVRFEGDNGRSLLFAVYDFLEAIGCRWIAPGRSGSRLPRGTNFSVPDSSGRQTPSLRGRCLAIGHAAFLKDAEDWIVWASRN